VDVAGASSPELIALGEAVRQARSERGLSQERLAQLSKLHRNYIGGIERGERNPSFVNIRKLAAALELRASALLAAGEDLE
jgi:transcriptional regulator with XRE-family HTH domain